MRFGDPVMGPFNHIYKYVKLKTVRRMIKYRFLYFKTLTDFQSKLSEIDR